jgi:hypothetical protein
LSTIVYCSLAGESHVLGAVYQRSGLANSSYSNTNFSFLLLDAAGGNVAALEVVGGTDYANDCCWSMTFSTIWNCSGTSIIYSSTGLYKWTSEPSKIVYCNFWRNTPSRSGALLHVYEVGLIVLFSYFSGSSNGNYFKYVTESRLWFFGSGCHFLREVSNVVAVNFHNTVVDGRLTSQALVNFVTQYCAQDATKLPPRTLAPAALREASVADASPSCNFLTDMASDRYDVPASSSCTVITDCFFANATGDSGGAVYINESSGPLFVSSTTFLRCSATKASGASGGALFVGSTFLDMADCCFRETLSYKYGSAMTLSSPNSSNSINTSDFVGCGDQGDGRRGTVYHAEPMAVYYLNLNFSECRLLTGAESGNGVVFQAEPTGGTWTFSYCTVLNCSGSSGLQSCSRDSGHIQYCNVYFNELHSGRALLYAVRTGMFIDGCLFNGNSGEFYRYTDSGELAGAMRFVVTNCVFSSSSPFATATYFDLTTPNSLNTTSDSHPLEHFNTHYCPTAPTASRSLSRSATCTCYVFKGLITSHQVVPSESACTLIIDSFFANTSADYGGAVDFNFRAGPLIVKSTTFLQCSSTAGYGGYGGALAIGANWFEIVSCCFRETKSTKYGSAVCTNYQEVHYNEINDSNLVSCGDSGGDRYGTIHIQSGITLGYMNLNFSECRFLCTSVSSGRGFVFLIDTGNAGNWSFYYCTVVNCSGTSGIDNVSPTVGHVEYCNFYFNEAYSSRGLICSIRIGIVVEHCIFVTGAVNEFYLFTDGMASDAAKFTITNCIFTSLSLPVGSYYDFTAANEFGTTTNSHLLNHFNTHYCPAPTTTGVAQPSAIFETVEFTHWSSPYFPSGHILRTLIYTYLLC